MGKNNNLEDGNRLGLYVSRSQKAEECFTLCSLH